MTPGTVDPETWDAEVAVVGGGPAGSTVAALLADLGHEVLLLDRARFPRVKPCGECVNPAGVLALRRLGLLETVRALPHERLHGWDLRSDAGGVARGRFPAGEVGIGVARERLDVALLRRAAARGVRVEEGVQVLAVSPGGPGGLGSDRPRIRARRGDRVVEIRARLVVGADGLRSVTARSLEVVPAPPSLRKVSLTARVRGDPGHSDAVAAGRSGARPVGTLWLDRAGTVGLAPVGGGRWNATVVVDPDVDGRELAADPAAFLLARLGERSGPWREGPALEGGPWASGPFDWPVRRAVGHGVVLVGDAAGYYDPTTGQGIHRALRSAELAAPVVDTALRAGRVSEEDLMPYDDRLQAEFSPGRRVQHVLEWVVSRGWARRPMLRRLARAPGAVDLLIRVTGDLAPPRTLLSSDFWLPLLRPAGMRLNPAPHANGR